MIKKRKGSNNFYVRVHIPKHLQARLGNKKTRWLSLRTPDRKIAKARAPAAIARIHQEIYGTPDVNLIKPTRSMLQRFARKYYEQQIEANLDERTHDAEHVRERYLENPNVWSEYVAELQEAFAVSDYSAVDTDFFAFNCGLDLPVGSVLYLEFEQMLMRAEIEAAQRYVEYDRANFSGTPTDPMLTTPYVEPAHESKAKPTTTARAGETLMDLYEKYAIHKSARVTKDTIEQRRKVVLRFSEYVGHNKKPSNILKTEAGTWRDDLYHWPLHANQKLAFKGKAFKDVIKANESVGHPTISVPTIISYVGDVSTYFDWLEREGHIPVNIVAGLAPEKEIGEQKVLPFTTDEMREFFNAPIYTGCMGTENIATLTQKGPAHIRDWRFWLPLIALYSGARQGEIAQLETKDIQNEKGIWFIHINNSGEDKRKSVKSAYAKRSIPIHSQLEKIGFLNFVAERKHSEATYLFPDLERDNKEQFGAVSKFFGKYLIRIGIKEKGNREKTFHSFRHGFTDELRKEYSEDQFKPLLGHSGRSVTGGYGTGETYSVAKRKIMIETVEYDGLNLDHIKPYVSNSR